MWAFFLTSNTLLSVSKEHFFISGKGLEEAFPQYYIRSDVLSIRKASATHFYVTRCVRIK